MSGASKERLVARARIVLHRFDVKRKHVLCSFVLRSKQVIEPRASHAVRSPVGRLTARTQTAARTVLEVFGGRKGIPLPRCRIETGAVPDSVDASLPAWALPPGYASVRSDEPAPLPAWALPPTESSVEPIAEMEASVEAKSAKLILLPLLNRRGPPMTQLCAGIRRC